MSGVIFSGSLTVVESTFLDVAASDNASEYIDAVSLLDEGHVWGLDSTTSAFDW